MMTVINALYFKGQWAEKFDKTRSAKGIFTRADGSEKEAVFMDQEAEFRFSRTDNPIGTVSPHASYVVLFTNSRGNCTLCMQASI